MIRGKCFTIHAILAIVCFICAGSVDMSRLKSANEVFAMTTAQKQKLLSGNQKNFKGQKFIKADLRNAKLSNTIFEEADLTGADLSGADLRNCDFTNAKLIGAKLNGSNCEKVSFRRADCSQASFWDTNLASADFTLASLQNCHVMFISKPFPNSLLKAANLRGVQISELKKSGLSFNNIDLRGSNFNHCTLDNASFVNTNLSSSAIIGGSWKNADFTGANLDGLKFFWFEGDPKPDFKNARVHVKYAGALKDKVKNYETIRFYN